MSSHFRLNNSFSEKMSKSTKEIIGKMNPSSLPSLHFLPFPISFSVFPPLLLVNNESMWLRPTLAFAHVFDKGKGRIKWNKKGSGNCCWRRSSIKRGISNERVKMRKGNGGSDGGWCLRGMVDGQKKGMRPNGSVSIFPGKVWLEWDCDCYLVFPTHI